MNTAGLRHPEASQPHEGKLTRPRQKTRVTHTSAKPWRVDNQGLSKTTPSYQQKTGSERKNPRKEYKKNSRSLDNHTVGTAKRNNQDMGRRVPYQKKAGTQAGPQPTNPSPTNPKGRNPARHKRRKRVRPKAKATETPEEPNTQELQVRPQTCDQPPQLKSR